MTPPIQILESTERGTYWVTIRALGNHEVLHHSEMLGTRSTAENNVRATVRSSLAHFLITARALGWRQAASALECEAELAELHGMIADDVLRVIREEQAKDGDSGGAK